MSIISSNSNFTCVYNNDGLFLIHPLKTTLVQGLKDIRYIEMDNFILNNIYIITNTQFIIGKCKNSFHIFACFNFEENLTNIQFIKFLYYQKSNSLILFFFIINDRIYFIDGPNLNYVKFSHYIKEAFVSLEKNSNEFIYMVDSANCFIAFHTEKLQVLKKFYISELMIKKITNDVDIEFNILVNDEGVLFFYTRKFSNNSISSVFVNNNEIKNPSLKLKSIKENNCGNYNFLKFKDKKEDEIMKNFTSRIFSVNYKKLSCVLFINNTKDKIFAIVYWNLKKKYNFYEINLPFNTNINKSSIENRVNAIAKNKKLKINILTEDNIVIVYKLEYFKTGNLKIIHEKSKEIFIDSANETIEVNNYFKKTKYTLSIKNKLNQDNSFINDNKIVFLPNLKIESMLVVMTAEDREILREEIIEQINEKLEDENFNNNLVENISKLINDKMDNILLKYEKKLEEQVQLYVKTMEKTLEEERLISIRLNKLVEFYNK